MLLWSVTTCSICFSFFSQGILEHFSSLSATFLRCNMYRNTWLRSVCVCVWGVKNNNNIHALNSTEESFHTCQIVTESAGEDTEGWCFVFQRLHGQYHQLTEQVDRNIAKNCPLLVLFDQHLWTLRGRGRFAVNPGLRFILLHLSFPIESVLTLWQRWAIELNAAIHLCLHLSFQTKWIDRVCR